MTTVVDVAIVGSGFAGSLLAMIARRLGRSVVLLERGTHPRVVIGESSTPLANLLLEELARAYDLQALLPLTKWGSWRRLHPEISCGLKRGFTFYHHAFGRPFDARPDRGDQLLVGASPHDSIADTHWYRSDVDHFLVREAQRIGVTYRDRVTLTGARVEEDAVTLHGRCDDGDLEVRARLVVDATGPRGFLSRALELGERSFERLPPTQALYGHFRNARRLDEGAPVTSGGETPPYPPDDAAVHHVFPGGWIWVLRFENGVTSAGVAATDTLAEELRLGDGLRAWRRLLDRLPTVAAQLAEAEPLFDLVHVPRLSYRSARIAGERWALLPSTAGFVDPLLSTGFPLTLLGIGRLAHAIDGAWEGPALDEALKDHAERTETELLAAESLIAALYASLDDFPVFASTARLYFAAASFTEAARRLGRAELAGSFLMHDHPIFGPACRTCVEAVLRGLSAEERADWEATVDAAIAPIDVAGLRDRRRRGWFPVEARDLLEAAGPLGVTREAVEALLLRSGFPPS